MNILFVLAGSTTGYSGGDLHAVSVANHWSSYNSVDVFLPANSSADVTRMFEGGVNFVGHRRLRGAYIGRKRLLLTYAIRTLRGSCYVLRHRKRWNIAVASSHYLFDMLPIILTSHSDCRKVIYWHHHFQGEAGRALWIRVLTRVSERIGIRLARSSGALVLTSYSGTREYLLKHGLRSDRVQVTKNASSLSLRRERRGYVATQPSISQPEDRIVLFCNRLSRLKGTRDLRYIVNRILNVRPGTKIVICGSDGDDGDALRQDLASAISDGLVVFKGFVDEDEKLDLFERAHVIMVPSYEEGWSITVGDGLLAGCWVVVYDLPAVRSAFPMGPIYVPVGDSEKFAMAVISQLDSPSGKPYTNLTTWDAIADEEMGLVCR